MSEQPTDDPFEDCELGPDAILGTQTFEDVLFTEKTATPVNVLTGEYGPIDPETGAEYRALGGRNHQYNHDYTVGSSYPKTVFVHAEDHTGDSLSHDALEAAASRS